MSADTVCKIIRQYNSAPLSMEDMQKLQEIAEDYAAVKNYVYQRYGGIRSLSKLYPGYTVQNEMTRSGLREQLGLPSVYFYLAVFEALGGIKNYWSGVKDAVRKRIHAHEGLTEEEKHFLRFLLKVSNAFESALNGTPLTLPGEVRRQYDTLAACVDVKKLENYLCRQVRKQGKTLHTDSAEGFSMAEKAYRYKDHGIYLSVKEKRKRIFIPLTDNNAYKRQLSIRLYPKEGNVEIRVPVETAVRKHEDYEKSVGLSLGITALLVTDEGRMYGEELGEYQMRISDWIRQQAGVYSRNQRANPGRKKYLDKKRRLEEQLHSYINQELNRFLRTEKPKVIYVPKLPGGAPGGPAKQYNQRTSTWQRGYIRKRLRQKCREHSVEFVEVFGKDISNVCSKCGNPGEKRGSLFFCPHCRYEEEQKINTARNVRKRGEQQTKKDHKDSVSDKFRP